MLSRAHESEALNLASLPAWRRLVRRRRLVRHLSPTQQTDPGQSLRSQQLGKICKTGPNPMNGLQASIYKLLN